MYTYNKYQYYFYILLKLCIITCITILYEVFYVTNTEVLRL